MHAARNGNASTVDILINNGADVELTNGFGNFSLC
jgi:ankyrin repeat protein